MRAWRLSSLSSPLQCPSSVSAYTSLSPHQPSPVAPFRICFPSTKMLLAAISATPTWLSLSRQRPHLPHYLNNLYFSCTRKDGIV